MLKEMNWTQQQMQEFLSRWEKLRAEASRGDKTAQQHYEESLQSLGLQNGAPNVRSDRMQKDSIKNLNEDSSVTQPPLPFRDGFREYLKLRSKAENN